MTQNCFYITTPIYYVNAHPHLGHAYSTVMADIERRFHRMRGEETFFLTGTDEHGDKIVQAARDHGIEPKEYADRISDEFRAAWPLLSVEPDRFIRTTDPDHVETVRRVLSLVRDRGDIEFREYEGLYCFGCERFYLERELVDGRCPDHGTVPSLIREKNYFFLMSRYQDWLVEHILSNPGFITPERYRNEVLSFLREPLEDLCISRPTTRLSWGIPLPFDENFVTYVWFDALINYLTGIGYPNEERFKRLWSVAEHVIAKDILKPHAIYWPTMLRSLGLAPPRRIHVHGYWRMGEHKMSKSLGNVVGPKELVSAFGVDATRYCLAREMVFGLDAGFSEDSFRTRINAELANDLGNLVSRTLAMVVKYRDGAVPAPAGPEGVEAVLPRAVSSLLPAWERDMEAFAVHRALQGVSEVVNMANKVIDSSAPWELARDPAKSETLDRVLYALLETLRIVSILVHPVMPGSAGRIRQALGLRDQEEPRLSDARWGLLSPTGRISPMPGLFPRIEVPTREGEETKQKRKKGNTMEEKHQTPEGAPAENLIPIETFAELDLRVAEILAAERIPKADRLLKLTVRCPEERTIVAGIAEFFAPEELIGRQVIVVANLKPVTLKGVTSQGMLLAAKDANGLHLSALSSPAVPGTRIK